MPEFDIPQVWRESLLALARRTIASRLGLPTERWQPVRDPGLDVPRGAFVTLHAHGSLRGCIGYIEAVEPLWAAIEEMANAAAFRDPRFPPVTAAEFGQLELEISVLSPLAAATPDQVVVGTHGIVLAQGRRRGLLLPQVATEQGWDRETFLEHGCMKAGLPPDAWRSGATLEIFSAIVFGENT